MKIYEEIKARIEGKKESEEAEYQKYVQLLGHMEQLIAADVEHLKLITAQMKNFDIHDNRHSEEVLKNMERLLGDMDRKNLSFVELLLLYLSAYLHDSAMALPEWEYTLLCAVEGTEKVYDRKNRVQIHNDMLPVQTLRETKAFIQEHKQDIYGNFDTVKKYVFALKDENAFLTDLAKLVTEYESFRNQYADELGKKLENETEYLELSERIRCEYIRSTHHLRVERNIAALKDSFSCLGGTFAAQMVDTLSKICRAHGEDRDFVFDLPYEGRMNNESVNAQFLAILLRLGDAIHFSADRAPLSLFAEKFITDATSRKHWNAKFQELGYKIENQRGTTRILFYAFCEGPQDYYFIQSYLEWIDSELDNYHDHIKKLIIADLPLAGRYKLPLDIKVDRSGIDYDKERFQPEQDLKFTLEQSRILELLMGVQLYKDKYLCLRELYQNSLDACRCMQAENKIHSVNEEFHIRFGLSEETDDRGIPRKYVYCLDNGTGMTKEIIKNHLLKIGNSYYKSKSFIRQNANWKGEVKPTSQFGIGILSCYMIADRIEITTKHYSRNERPICLALDGVAEHSYYVKVDDIEAETIGSHGTLIKLFLNEETAAEINDDNIERLQYSILFFTNWKAGRFIYTKTLVDKLQKSLKHNLFFLINSQVGLPKKEISVEICTQDKEVLGLIPWDTTFNYADSSLITDDEIYDILFESPFWTKNSSYVKETLESRSFVKNIPIKVSNENIELYTSLCLPLPGIPTIHYHVVNRLSDYIWAGNVIIFVDGIYTDRGHKIFKSGWRNCIINFIGSERPILSVDRSSLVSIPEKLELEVNQLMQDLPQKCVDALVAHMAENKILPGSNEARLSIEAIFSQFYWLLPEIIRITADREWGELSLKGMMNSTLELTIRELVNNNKITLRALDMRNLSRLERDTMIGRLISAQSIRVEGNEVTIESVECGWGMHTDFFKAHTSMGDGSQDSLLIRADSWEGKYSEYDLVSGLWPIVAPGLYERYKIRLEGKELRDGGYRGEIGNGENLNAISRLDPVLVYPDSSLLLGKMRKERRHYGNGPELRGAYKLSELNGPEKTTKEENRACVLFALISPRELDEDEKKILPEFASNEVYMKGVREGWSILFLSRSGKYYIKPGLATRQELYEMASQDLSKNKEDEIEYCDTAGNLVIDKSGCLVTPPAAVPAP